MKKAYGEVHQRGDRTTRHQIVPQRLCDDTNARHEQPVGKRCGEVSDAVDPLPAAPETHPRVCSDVNYRKLFSLLCLLLFWCLLPISRGEKFS